jgi:hypothetical protein
MGRSTIDPVVDGILGVAVAPTLRARGFHRRRRIWRIVPLDWPRW